MAPKQSFFVYPANPAQIGQTIEGAAAQLRHRGELCETWRQIDLPGHFLIDGILEKIDKSDFVIADITRLNFNVTFEIGYAIGKNKRVYLVINSAVTPQIREITSLGIFDTLGYVGYTNQQDLSDLLAKIKSTDPAKFPSTSLDKEAPIYVLEIAYKTDAAHKIISRIKKSRIRYRSFDPRELSRLSTIEAYRNVASSAAIIVHLLSTQSTDHYVNNQRGAFLAGLAYGLGKVCLILQEGQEPVPLDYRDFAKSYKDPSEIDKYINELAPQVMDALQGGNDSADPKLDSILATLDLGATAAENEMTRLGSYYLPTENYTRALSGGVRLVVGRKGSGKTAMFVQIRNKIRSERNNIVIDLKPEGHQLKRFKDMLLRFLGTAEQEHLSTAFWEYVLLLELCYKVLEADRQNHLYNPITKDNYNRLVSIYNEDDDIREGDFSERMNSLVQRIEAEFEEKRQNSDIAVRLSVKDVVHLIYKHDIKSLRNELAAYLRSKKAVWILFDNIDKGWPTRGVEDSDIIILRSLLEATRDIERLFQRREVIAHTVIFLRNDVFELLVNDTPDRGKESKISLDWTDPELLKEIIRKRIIVNNGIDRTARFDDIWNRICVSHIEGENTMDLLIELSLMRPRNLLNLVSYAKSNAVNLGHAKIMEEDIKKAISQYSADLGTEIGLEIRDVFPQATDILYLFIGAKAELSLRTLCERLAELNIPDDRLAYLVEILLWFSFIGVVPTEADKESEVQYCYSVYYDMKKLRRLAKDFQDPEAIFAIHRAFWPFLEIH